MRRAILTTLHERKDRNWSATDLAAEVRQGSLSAVQAELDRLRVLRYIDVIPARGGPFYIIQGRGQAALEDDADDS